MRKFILAIILLLGIYFVITRFTEFQTVADTLLRGDWRFILLALIVELAWLVNIGSSFRTIYGLLGEERELMYMIRLAASANFLNVIAPAGGMTGIAVFLADARRRGRSPARAAVAGALFVLFDYASTLTVTIIGLFVLFRRNNLHWTELTATIILFFMAVFLSTILLLAMRSPRNLGRVLAWLARLVNRILWPFIHRDYLEEVRAYTYAHEIAEGVSVLRNQPKTLLLPYALSMSSKALLISVFFLTFLAFKVEFSVGTLIAGFSIAYLFLIVSPTPSGLGVVEGALTLALTTLNVPLEAATVIVLAYRGITFWFPLVIGMIAFRSLTGLNVSSKIRFN